MKEKSGYRRATGLASVQYTKPRKPIKTAEERRREENSLVIKNINNGGGGGCA